MLTFLLAHQGRYTKYLCFLCLRKTRADDQHYSRKQWSLRKKLTPVTHKMNQSPIPRFERKDFVANTPHKTLACKAVYKGFEIRQ